MCSLTLAFLHYPPEEKTNSGKGYRMIMFVPPKNVEAELWDGPRTGLEGARELFGADEVRNL